MRKEDELDICIRRALDARFSSVTGRVGDAERVLRLAKGEENPVKKKLSVAFILVMALVLGTAGALAASAMTAHYAKVGFADNAAYDKWSVWLGGLPELDKIDALVDRLSDGLYEENIIKDAVAKDNPQVRATEKKALRTALYSLWNVADPDFFSLDTFEPLNYHASVAYEETIGNDAGTWHVRLNPVQNSDLPYYYAEVSATNNQLIRIHKLSDDGTKTLKIIYFGAIEQDYDEFIAMGQSG